MDFDIWLQHLEQDFRPLYSSYSTQKDRVAIDFILDYRPCIFKSDQYVCSSPIPLTAININTDIWELI